MQHSERMTITKKNPGPRFIINSYEDEFIRLHMQNIQ